MKRLAINITALLLQGVSIVLLFIPGMFYWEHWEKESWAVSTLDLRMNATYFHITGNTSEVLGYFIVFLIILSAVWILLDILIPDRIHNLFKAKKIIRIIDILLPSLILVFMFIFMIVAKKRDDYGYQAPPSTLFYIEIFILAVIVFLSILKSTKFGYVEKTKEAAKSNEMDRLTQYKQMLDKGLITEEDYEDKKKEILNIDF